MPKKLTDADMRKLKCGPTAHRKHDSGTGSVRGLHVLVQPSGTKTYRVNLARNNAAKLGRVEDITLEQARDKAVAVPRRFGKGLDPLAEANQCETFGQVVTRWCSYQLNAQSHVPASVKSTKGFVLSSCAGWAHLYINSITREDITKLLEAKRDAGTKHAANRLHAHLSTLFKFAVKREWETGLEVNPMLGVERPWGVTRCMDRRCVAMYGPAVRCKRER